MTRFTALEIISAVEALFGFTGPEEIYNIRLIDTRKDDNYAVLVPNAESLDVLNNTTYDLEHTALLVTHVDMTATTVYLNGLDYQGNLSLTRHS